MFYHLSRKKISFSIPIIALMILTKIPNHVVFAQESEQYVACKDRVFNCGDKQNLPYPFWGPGRPSYCGHPAYELNCTGSTPLITISAITYRILNIDEDKRAFTVARQDYWITNCPAVKRNSTLESDLPTFFKYSSDSTNLTFFYKCPPVVNLAVFQIYFNCSGDTGTTTNFYGTEQMVNTDLRSLIPDCGDTVVVRISNSQATTLQSALTTPTPSAKLRAALTAGFDVDWNANNSRCDECKDSGGLCGSSNASSVEFSCYCKDGIFLARCGLSSDIIPTSSTPPGSSSERKGTIAIMVGVSAGIIILSIVFICFYRRSRKSRKGIIFWRRDTRDEFDVEEFIRNYGSFAPKRYSYANVKKMTNSFAEKIGAGGFGSVYKGKLPNGCLVAVKMLNECKNDGQDFVNEVASIGRTSHVNIVTLLGFCCEKNKRALIYEYMVNGSLDRLIFNRESSNTERCSEWPTLFEIALGIARGLEYLHRGCNTTILHLDIKPQNILLDDNLCPKISDFGLAQLWLKKEKTLSMVGARGTIGYMAPEVFSRAYGRVSQKSDVYSYGMLVLEMVGGRKNFDSGVSHTSEIYFPNKVYAELQLDIESTLMGEKTEEKEVSMKMILVGFWCIQTNPANRPSMSKVVDMLQGSCESLEAPPKPYLFSPTRSPAGSSTVSFQDFAVET